MNPELVTLAKWHRLHSLMAFWAFISFALVFLYRLFLDELRMEISQPYFVGIGVCGVMLIITLVLTCILASHTHRSITSTAFLTLLLFIPGINLIIILVINSQGAKKLKSEGIDLGLFGVRRSHKNESRPPSPKAREMKKLKVELTVFPMILGILFAAPGILLLLNGLPNDQMVFGVLFSMVLAVGILIAAFILFGSGIVFAFTRKKTFSYSAAVGSTLIPLLYGLAMVFRTGSVPLNIMSIVIVVIPILHWLRTSKYEEIPKRID